MLPSFNYTQSALKKLNFLQFFHEVFLFFGSIIILKRLERTDAMFLRKVSIVAACSILLLVPSVNTSAAAFSSGETSQVQHYQKEYAALSKTEYDINNIYQVKPHLSKPFSYGKLKSAYISDQLAYINYYRSLFGLPAIRTNSISNDNAQKTAAIMAAINANPFINQHGLPSDTRPSYISSSLWKLAQDTSETSNLNFNVAKQSAGDVVTDLLTDHYNLTGSDTGHRAWLLSTRLSTTGIGAAYGTNGYRYSVEKVLNVNDLFRPATQAVVSYPSSGLFPIELTKGRNIAWSLYLSNRTYNGKPRITITDNDTHKTYRATRVTNYSRNGFGNFKTVITYYPGRMPIISGHQYTVTISRLYHYKFKLFKENAETSSDTASQSSTYQNSSIQQDTKTKSDFSRTNSKLWAIFTPTIKQSSTKYYYFDALKKGKWKQNFFLQRFQRIIQVNKTN